MTNLITRVSAAISAFRAPSQIRSLDAAGAGRRWFDDRSASANANGVHGQAALIGQRAAQYVLNTPEGARIADSLVGNLVGTGITPRPMHGGAAVRDYLASSFLTWTDIADAAGGVDFYGMQAELCRDMVVYGEGLTVRSGDPATGAPQLRRLHPEQIDRAKWQEMPGGGRIVQGVEFNSAGRIVAYWIRPSAPGEALVGIALNSVRIPASEVIHLFRRLVPGQVRGLSWFAPVLLPGRDLDALLDAMLMRAKVSAMFVGSLHDPDGSGGGMEGDQSGATLDVTAEPGTIRVELNGSRLDWSEPPDSGDTVAHSKAVQRRIALGAGVTYEQASGDYSEVNYSSARAALLEFRRFAEGIQHNVLVFQLCRPVWEAFVRWQVLSGSISASAYSADRAAFGAKWLPPAWPWVDPEKDAKAAVLEIDNLLRSRAEVVAERGYDIEALDREIAADRDRAARLNIAKKDIPNASA